MKRPYLVIDPCQFTANYNYCLLEAMAARGERIVYAATEFAHGHMPEPKGVKVLRCYFHLARLVGRFTSSRLVRRFLRAVEYPFDIAFVLAYVLIRRIRVVHMMWVVSPLLEYPVIRFLKLMGRRVVYTAHNPFPHEWKSNHTNKYGRIYRAVDHTITLTQYTRDEIAAHVHIPVERISVIPHGDYEALFRRYGLNEKLADDVRERARDRRIAAFLGHIRPYKGLEYFIEAIPAIRRGMSDVFFVIAGSMLVGDRRNVEQMLAQVNDPGDMWVDIRFLPVEDMKAYLSVIDLLVQPYTSASQSGNTVMAYAAGVPVVSTNVGGLGEMTEDGVTGYVVPPRNAAAIAEAVAKCFEDETYAGLSRNARRAAAEEYGWDKIATRTVDAYRGT